MQGLYVAAVASQQRNADRSEQADHILAQAKQHMLLVVHPTGSTPQYSVGSSSLPDDAAAADDGHAAAGASCQTASEGQLYWPAQGGQLHGSSWQLQDVLLPSEVAYLHPDYITNAHQLVQASGVESKLTVSGLERFFTQGLGLLVRPVPGSPEQQAAVDAGGRWRPLLLMLSDIWRKYGRAEKEQLQEQLCNVQVEAGCGSHPLCQCIVPAEDFPPDLLTLLQQLQLPILNLPAGHDWSFLQQLGVSTELNWTTLHKVLRQLSEANLLTGSTDDLAAMRRLYEQVYAQALQSPDTAADVRSCFEQEPLLLVRVQQEGAWQCFWVTCKDVMWSGNSKMFPDRTFIWSLYKDLEAFFCKQLGVRSTSVDDLKDALEGMSKRSIVSDTPKTYLGILKQLASNASELPWLPELLQQPVLLTRAPAADSDSHNLVFMSAASASAPYLPDREQLVELFGRDCNLLAVPPEEVPALQPLLQLLQPQLQTLSSSITRTVTLQDRNAEVQPHAKLTQQLQETVKLAARCLYTKAPQQYLQLLQSGQLQQLVGMEAYSAPSMVETLSLTAADGKVLASRSLPSGAGVFDVPADPNSSADSADGRGPGAVTTCQAMLVNTSKKRGSQNRAMATAIAELLCSSGGLLQRNALLDQLSDKLKLLLSYVSSDDAEEAELDLQGDGIVQIPRDKRPWLLPEEAAAAAAAATASSGAASGTWSGAASAQQQLWAYDADEGADAVADTADTAKLRTKALTAAQARIRTAAEDLQALPDTAAATAAAGAPVAAVDGASVAAAAASAGAASAPGAFTTGSSAASSVQHTESTTQSQARSLRLTEDGSLAFAGPAPAAEASSSDDSDSWEELMMEALAAGAAAGKCPEGTLLGSFLQSCDSPAARSELPAAPGAATGAPLTKRLLSNPGLLRLLRLLILHSRDGKLQAARPCRGLLPVVAAADGAALGAAAEALEAAAEEAHLGRAL